MKRLVALAFAWLAGVAAATVNVNTAQQSELQRVKGLDKFTAKRIIEYRAQNGDFRSVDELSNVLGHDAYEAVKPQLAVTGDPYVPPPKPEKPAKKKPKKTVG